MTIGETALLIGSKGLFIRTVKGIYQLITDKAGREIKQWDTERKIEELWKKIWQVREVKTIWQIDKSVDLGDFYCDSHVVVKGNRLKISSLADFPKKKNLLIQGIAGQGKTIFLRYLCSVELSMGNCIPIFLELRRISRQSSLNDRIKIAFESLDLDINAELFKDLSGSGKIILFLDAFDEIPDELKVDVLTDMEDLANKHEKLRIIVTSRPDSHIQMSSRFSIVKLDNLRGIEFSTVIKKLSAGEEEANALIKHIDTNAPQMRDLLITPLIVTLLVVSYKAHHKLPNKMPDFYSKIFETLLQRHDGSKPGFNRERGCSLEDGQYRRIFDALCIVSKKQGGQFYSFSTMTKLVEEAMKESALVANPERYLKDIVKITCLILRDGEEYRFVHKTVQEFHVATFIVGKPDTWGKEFYQKALESQSRKEWVQELEFLSEIDIYRFNRYYKLPGILNTLGISEGGLDNKPPAFSSDIALSICRCFWVILDRDGVIHEAIWSDSRGPIKSEFLLENPMETLKEFFQGNKVLGATYGDILAESGMPNENLLPFEKKYYRDGFVHGSHLIEFAGLTDAITKAFEKSYSKLFKRAKELKKALQAEETPKFLDGLL